MSDAELIEKVRAAAGDTLQVLADDTMAAEHPNSHAIIGISARAALALVEQYEDLTNLAEVADAANCENFAAGRPVMASINSGEASAYRTSAARILASLRKAVG